MLLPEYNADHSRRSSASHPRDRDDSLIEKESDELTAEAAVLHAGETPTPGWASSRQADPDDLSCYLASLIDETAPNGAHRLNNNDVWMASRPLMGAQSTTWQSTRPWPWTCPSAARYSHAQSGRGRDGLPMPVFGVWRRDGPSLAEQHQDGHEEFHDSLEHGRGVGRDASLRPPSICGHLRSDNAETLSCALSAPLRGTRDAAAPLHPERAVECPARV